MTIRPPRTSTSGTIGVTNGTMISAPARALVPATTSRSCPLIGASTHQQRWPSDLTPLALELWSSFELGRDWLVHGDFHHHNVLRHTRGHVAIDPISLAFVPDRDSQDTVLFGVTAWF